MTREISAEVIVFQTNELQQAATIFRPREASGAGVLFLSSYASDREGHAEYAEIVGDMLGVTSLTLDLSGHGESEGQKEDCTINGHLEEVKTAIDILADQKAVAADRIGVMGASYGGYLAVMLSTTQPIDRLLLRAPALYPDGLRDIPRGEWDVEAINTYRREIPLNDAQGLVEGNENLRAAHKFGGKLHIVRSENDESIPGRVMDAYELAAWGLAKQRQHSTITGASHSLNPQEKQVFKAHLLGWAADLSLAPEEDLTGKIVHPDVANIPPDQLGLSTLPPEVIAAIKKPSLRHLIARAQEIEARRDGREFNPLSLERLYDERGVLDEQVLARIVRNLPAWEEPYIDPRYGTDMSPSDLME